MMPSTRDMWMLVVVLMGAGLLLGFGVTYGIVLATEPAETTRECLAKLLPGSPGQPANCTDWSAAVDRCWTLGDK